MDYKMTQQFSYADCSLLHIIIIIYLVNVSRLLVVSREGEGVKQMGIQNMLMTCDYHVTIDAVRPEF